MSRVSRQTHARMNTDGQKYSVPIHSFLLQCNQECHLIGTRSSPPPPTPTSNCISICHKVSVTGEDLSLSRTDVDIIFARQMAKVCERF